MCRVSTRFCRCIGFRYLYGTASRGHYKCLKMYATGGNSLILLLSVASLATFSFFAISPVVADMYVPGPCPNRGNGCPQAGTHDNTHIHLGGFMSDDGLPPFEITVFKSDLTSDLPFTLTADSQVSTGFSWLCLGIYTEEQRASVAGRHEEFYRDLLTTDFMRDSMTKGKDAYGISVSPFAVHSGGAGVDSSIQRVCVGKSEVSKATLTVRSSIQEGSYYVHLAYASPFRDRPMVCFKELLVRVLP